ncbi:MAG TPA: cytochrome c biogenesis protein CcsA [Candidatus Thermoplasmatota archaeon]|nr:cytochrome c biogenesis protein CcsA [Candidatus Thermoplasmatota archaeon]
MSRYRPLLLGATGLALFVLIYLSLAVAPEAAFFEAPLTQRIFYYHVPAATAAYVAFGITFLGSLYVLWNEDKQGVEPRLAEADRWAAAAAEVGTLFSVVALVTGLLWARVEFVFNYNAFQDPKVISLVALIVAYLGYFALRRGVSEPTKRRRLSAVFGIAAVIGVPLTYFTSRVSVHPEFLRDGQDVSGGMLGIMFYGMFAFALLTVTLVDLRRGQLALADRIDALEESS